MEHQIEMLRQEVQAKDDEIAEHKESQKDLEQVSKHPFHHLNKLTIVVG